MTPSTRALNNPRPPHKLKSNTTNSRSILCHSIQSQDSSHPPSSQRLQGETAETNGATTQIAYLSSAIDSLLDTILEEWDFISCIVNWPSNLSSLSKGFLGQGMFPTQHCKAFADAQDKMGFSILSLILPIKGKVEKHSNSMLHDAELLPGEVSENLTIVDTIININTTMPPSTGLSVCANMVLLCRIFAQVQSELETDHETHSTPFLFDAASQLGFQITQRQLLDTIAGNSKQAILLLYTVIACLDTISTCIRMEAANLDMLCQVQRRTGSWPLCLLCCHACKALTMCLQQL